MALVGLFVFLVCASGNTLNNTRYLVEKHGGECSFFPEDSEWPETIRRWTRTNVIPRRMADIRIHSTTLDDATFRKLNLRTIDSLYLNCPSLTVHSLETIDASNLETLFLEMKSVNDDWIKAIIPLPSLRTLSLSGTSVTDVSVESLLKFANLEYLHIEDTAITGKGAHRASFAPRLQVITASPRQLAELSSEQLDDLKKRGRLIGKPFRIQVLNAAEGSELQPDSD